MEPGLSVEVQTLAQRQATLCKVFSSAQRVLILWFLVEREHTVSEIAGALGASLPSIYYRLADNDLLRNCLVLANLPKEKLAEIMPEA